MITERKKGWRSRVAPDEVGDPDCVPIRWEVSKWLSIPIASSTHPFRRAPSPCPPPSPSMVKKNTHHTRTIEDPGRLDLGALRGVTESMHGNTLQQVVYPSLDTSELMCVTPGDVGRRRRPKDGKTHRRRSPSTRANPSVIEDRMTDVQSPRSLCEGERHGTTG